jgi:glucosyl-dolichyl phosphate glucuronosyltransferase
MTIKEGSSNPSETGVSVIICTHSERRWQYLIRAIQSVFDQSVQPKEIIVVVDHNDFLQKKVISTFPGIRCVSNPSIKGASGSKNTGVSTASAEIVFFLDDDAYADKDWIKELSAELNENSIMGAGGATLPDWTNTAPLWLPEEFYWVIGCTHKGMPEQRSFVRNLIACNMAVRKEVFQAIGGFRDGIGPNGTAALGCEETEFCIRANQHYSRQIWIHQPIAKAYHNVPPSRCTWRYFLKRCFGEGISKALIKRFVGSQAALSSELAYLIHDIPGGVFKAIGAFVSGKGFHHFQRAISILVGLSVTALGYIWGGIRFSLNKPSAYASKGEVLLS